LRTTPDRPLASRRARGRLPNWFSVVGNKKEHIERLQLVIFQLRKCDSMQELSVPVVEEFQGRTVWDGDVEVFAVNHPKTQTAYAWSDADGNFTAVLGVPPATDPRNAVKVSIVAAAKKGR
jgi:hypothetical protein